jgi:hypothetical protein
VDINGGYRFTFEIKEDTILLRRAGAYDEKMEWPRHW